jgi:hypothetical protein
MPLSHSSLYLLLCPNICLSTTHLLSLYTWTNKETFLNHVNSHVRTTDMHLIIFCTIWNFKQMFIHMVKECGISEWLKYYWNIYNPYSTTNIVRGLRPYFILCTKYFIVTWCIVIWIFSLYQTSPIHFHGVMINWLSIGTTLPYLTRQMLTLANASSILSYSCKHLNITARNATSFLPA